MYIVITRTHFSADTKQDTLAMTDGAIEIASKQRGLISMRVHLAEDQSHMMTYWAWESEQDHLNCMNSDDWSEWNPRWESLIEKGVSFDLQPYSVLAEATAS